MLNEKVKILKFKMQSIRNIQGVLLKISANDNILVRSIVLKNTYVQTLSIRPKIKRPPIYLNKLIKFK